MRAASAFSRFASFMSSPLHKPPESKLSRKPRPLEPGSPLRAVLMGMAVDIVGSALVGVVLVAVYALQLQGTGLSDDALREALQRIPPDSGVAVAGTVLGALMSVAGGYVCARVVRRDEYRVGLVMAALLALWGLLADGGGTDDLLTLLFTATSVACNMLGVKYGAEHNRRLEAPPAVPPQAPAP